MVVPAVFDFKKGGQEISSLIYDYHIYILKQSINYTANSSSNLSNAAISGVTVSN